jgi:hypothetical protein
MLLAFGLGKSGAISCGGNTQTRIGIFYTLRANATTRSDSFFPKTKTALADTFPFLKPVLGVKQPNPSARQILIQQGNNVLTVANPKTLDLTAYNTRQIFVTGKVNSCENTIEVENESSVQLLP